MYEILAPKSVIGRNCATESMRRTCIILRRESDKKIKTQKNEHN